MFEMNVSVNLLVMADCQEEIQGIFLISMCTTLTTAAAAPHCSATGVLCVVCFLCAVIQDVHGSLSERFGRFHQLTKRCTVRHPVYHQHLCDCWQAHRAFEGKSPKGVGLVCTL